jgi:hypothetical protein
VQRNTKQPASNQPLNRFGSGWFGQFHVRVEFPAKLIPAREANWHQREDDHLCIGYLGPLDGRGGAGQIQAVLRGVAAAQPSLASSVKVRLRFSLRPPSASFRSLVFSERRNCLPLYLIRA